MLAVVWSETADEDLAVITNFIGRRNLIAAERLWAKIPVNVCRAVDKLWFAPITLLSTKLVCKTYEFCVFCMHASNSLCKRRFVGCWGVDGSNVHG